MKIVVFIAFCNFVLSFCQLIHFFKAKSYFYRHQGSLLYVAIGLPLGFFILSFYKGSLCWIAIDFT